MATTLEQLKAERDRLAKEYEAIQAEFSAGTNFLSGNALIDQERREIAKFKELSEINRQIRIETKQLAASGQTAENQIQNTNTPDQAATPISADDKKKLDAAKSGSLSATINQSQDPTAANKQNLTNNQGPAAKSESNFSQDINTATTDSV